MLSTRNATLPDVEHIHAHHSFIFRQRHASATDGSGAVRKRARLRGGGR